MTIVQTLARGVRNGGEQYARWSQRAYPTEAPEYVYVVHAAQSFASEFVDWRIECEGAARASLSESQRRGVGPYTKAIGQTARFDIVVAKPSSDLVGFIEMKACCKKESDFHADFKRVAHAVTRVPGQAFGAMIFTTYEAATVPTTWNDTFDGWQAELKSSGTMKLKKNRTGLRIESFFKTGGTFNRRNVGHTARKWCVGGYLLQWNPAGAEF